MQKLQLLGSSFKNEKDELTWNTQSTRTTVNIRFLTLIVEK